jgi:hypothetical protein
VIAVMTPLISILIGSAWGASCTERFVEWRGSHSICAEWARAGATLASYRIDGVEFVIPNPLRTSPSEPSPKSSSKSSSMSSGDASFAAMKREFNSLVTVMTKQVAGDVSNGLLSAPRRYLVSRLRSVSLEALPASDSLCAPPTQVNARYTERTNAIQVCPWTTRLPVAAWLPLIAHELGHLADPCNFRQGFAYTDRLPRTSDGVRRAVRACGVDAATADVMADGDHRADRALGLTPSSSESVRKAIPKLIACGLLRPTSDPEIPATYEGHPYFDELQSAARAAGVQLQSSSRVAEVAGLCSSSKADKETAADRIGFRVLAAFLRAHSLKERPKEHGEWITYFYASVNCSPDEHRSNAVSATAGYASASARMSSLLQIPEVRALAKCE